MVTATKPDRRTVNIAQAAKELGVSRGLLSEQARRGKLPFPILKIGTRMVVSRAVLDKVLAGEYSGAPNDDRAA